MKQFKIRKIMLLLFIASISLFSCEKEGDEIETKISMFNSSESHKNGQNCMSCHKKGGEGEGWFTVAGSVYNKALTSSYPGATIKITTEAQNAGTIRATIEVDKNGNFYTTKAITLADGVYVSVTGTGGATKFMGSKITTGQCNSCHGNTTDKIGVE